MSYLFAMNQFKEHAFLYMQSPHWTHPFSFSRMLRRKFFHRAKKMAISDRDLRRKQLKKLKKLEEEEKKKVSKGGDHSESEHEDRRGDDKSNAEETAGEKSAVEGEASPKASRKVRRGKWKPSYVH